MGSPLGANVANVGGIVTSENDIIVNIFWCALFGDIY